MPERRTHSGDRRRPPAAAATAAGEWAAQRGWAAADAGATAVPGPETHQVQDHPTHGAPAYLHTAQQAPINQQGQGRPVVLTAPAAFRKGGSVSCSASCLSGIAQRFRLPADLGLVHGMHPAACHGSGTSKQADGCRRPTSCTSGRSANTAKDAGATGPNGSLRAPGGPPSKLPVL